MLVIQSLYASTAAPRLGRFRTTPSTHIQVIAKQTAGRHKRTLVCTIDNFLPIFCLEGSYLLMLTASPARVLCAVPGGSDHGDHCLGAFECKSSLFLPFNEYFPCIGRPLYSPVFAWKHFVTLNRFVSQRLHEMFTPHHSGIRTANLPKITPEKKPSYKLKYAN